MDYPSQDYICEESGLTDVVFLKYAELLAIMQADSLNRRREQATDIMLRFQDAVFGDTFGEVQEYIEGHVESCEPCKKHYDADMKTVNTKAEIFKKEDRDPYPPQ
jgi:hypothetical protein